MKRNSIIAMAAILFFAACSNQGTTKETSSTDSTAKTITDTSVSGVTTPPASGNPASGSGNNAAGTSNAGINGTDTAAIGTNRTIPKDTIVKHKKQ